jgi:hypothetical protein
VSRWLQAAFGPSGEDVPLATDGCALVAMRHVSAVGRPDVALDETGWWEWALRARRAGLRAVLVPGCLVDRPPAPPGAPDGAEELVVRSRFPLLPVQLDAVVSSGGVARLRHQAVVSIARAAARRDGWHVADPDGADAVVVARPSAHGRAAIDVDGFRTTIELAGSTLVDAVTELLGRPPALARRPQEVHA